ncbi:RulB protein, partial [Pseudomonas syringae pv. actinidiae ICMP 19070]
MAIIESMVPAVEVYIDEAFADLTGMPGNLTELGRS